MPASLPNSIKSTYAATVSGAGKLLVHVRVMSATPPDRSHRWRHWTHSLTGVYDARALAELDVPWWTYSAIDAVEAWLSARPRPIRVFEYGSGASTLWLARRTDEVHSVEHHKEFAESMQSTFAKADNIQLLIREPVPSDTPVIPSSKHGHTGMDFAEYVGAIDQVGGAFDLIVLDGRAREAALRAAIPHLAPDGLIVFDNTRRKRYQKAVLASGLSEQVFRGLTPSLPYPDRTSLLSRTER